MARRAFIVAIEQYARMEEGLAGQLVGTHKSAVEFRRWLIDEQDVLAADITLCADDPTLEGRTAGATRDDIEDQLIRLRDAGRNETEHLYAYLAGHGFTYTDVDDERLADVLLLEDYRRRDRSGNACLKIDRLQTWLRRALGPGEHFYFVDCCRNPIGQAEIRVGDIGLILDGPSNGDPTIHTLYSTIEGAVAAVGSGFSAVLIAGLRGAGRAKVWLDDYSGMAVKFTPVWKYVEGHLIGQEVDAATWGPGEGILRELVPAPTYDLRVLVENAAPDDPFAVDVSTARGQPLPPEAFTGSERIFQAWPPDGYNLVLTTPGHDVQPLDPLPADLYDPLTLRFRKTPVSKGDELLAVATPPTEVTVRGPDHATVRVLGMSRREPLEDGEGVFTQALAADRYFFDVHDQRGVRVRRHALDVVAGDEQFELDLRTFARSPLRDSLLSRLPHGAGAVDFSEMLRTPDQGLDLWVATIGAARILQETSSEFADLGRLPLAAFFDTPEDAAPLYILAGFDEPPQQVRVTVDGDTHTLASHPDLPGLFELLAPSTAPGSHLVSLEVDGLARLTLATAGVANRATLVTFTRHPADPILIRQLILPLPHLAHRLAPYGPQATLDTVRRAIEIQRQFEGGRKLVTLIGEDALSDLLYLKWSETVSCLLGAYELARRGHVDRLRMPVRNLTAYFPELPDAAVLARMAGLEWNRPVGPPLVLDGLLSYDRLPLPAEALDYRGPWTLWRGAPPT